MTRRYSVLFASLLLLNLPGCSTTGKAPQQTTPSAPDEAGNNEPDLLQKLRERMAGGSHATAPKPTEAPSIASKDSSKATGVAAAAAASGVAIDPVKQQKALAVAGDYAQAMALASSGQDDQALALLQQISTKVPEFSGPLVNQGVILERQGHYPEAEKVLRQAIVVNGKNAFAYNELGMSLRQQGKFADAKSAYLSALDIDPGYAKAHFNLGVLADLYLQDYPLAIAQYQAYQGLQQAPDKTVGNWIVDLQKRTGTYKPPPKPVAAAPAAASGDAAASAGSGTAATTAGSGPAPAAASGTASPAPTTPATGGKS